MWAASSFDADSYGGQEMGYLAMPVPTTHANTFLLPPSLEDPSAIFIPQQTTHSNFSSSAAEPFSPSPLNHSTSFAVVPSSSCPSETFSPPGTRRRSGSIDSEASDGDNSFNQNPGRYKTELCHSWTETQTCRYGHKCQFAHGEAELRRVDRHPKFKSEKCVSSQTEVLLGNGSVRPACEITVNDTLVGDDGKPRVVEDVWSGTDILYTVMIAGQPSFKCTRGHLLVVYIPPSTVSRRGAVVCFPAFRYSADLDCAVPYLHEMSSDGAAELERERQGGGDVVWEVTTEKFVLWARHNKALARECRMKRAAVPAFPHPTPLAYPSAYELGAEISAGGADEQLAAAIVSQPEKFRRSLLAGIVDSTKDAIERESVRRLALRVSRSLGVRVAHDKNTRLAFTDEPALFPFSIHAPSSDAPPEPFIGLSVSGNGRFLLGDFTVCHNCKAFHLVGQCPYGSRCRFIHTRARTVPPHIEALQSSNIFTMSTFLSESPSPDPFVPLVDTHPESVASTPPRRLPIFMQLNEEQ